MPALLCSQAETRHAGTTDVDVQVNLEIGAGSVNTARLEKALRDADFRPDAERVWRWKSDVGPLGATVKFELLADLATQPAGVTLRFDNCEHLGAANLRGTGFAARDREVRELAGNDHGILRQAEIYVTGLAAFLLAKIAASRSRRKAKDWYDIAYVLLNNDFGDPTVAARRTWQVFGAEIASAESVLRDLEANFATSDAQGTSAYAEQTMLDRPGTDPGEAAADSQIAVQTFCDYLFKHIARLASR